MDASPPSREPCENGEEEETKASATQRDLAAEAQFVARVDPLALLEAEYAAVLAQSRPAADSDNDSESEVGGHHEDGEDNGAYSALPTSPTSSSGFDDVDDRAESDFYQRLGDDSDGEANGELEREDDQHERNEGEEHEVTGAWKRENPQLLETATRSAIMQSMQRLALTPPPWARDASLSDDDLVAMVQHQLQG